MMLVRKGYKGSVWYMQPKILQYPKYQAEREKRHTDNMQTHAVFYFYAIYFAQIIQNVITEWAMHGNYFFSKKAQIQFHFPRVCLHSASFAPCLF